mgnify:CR=1 FL=1
MPLVKVSIEQLEAGQELYEAATEFINRPLKEDRWGGVPTRSLLSNRFEKLVAAVTHCKEEYEKHG